MVALFGITAMLMLLSAYGAVCVTYNIPPGMFWMIFPYVETFNWVYVLANIITWIFPFVWGVVIWAHMTNKSYAWLSAVVVSAVGFVSGLIPWLISQTDGFTAGFEFGGARLYTVGSNLIVLILLLIPPIKKGLKTFSARDNKWGGNLGGQLAIMSTFFFFLALWSFLATEFMRDAHIVNGVNVWQTIAIQFYGGITITIIGAAMLTTGLIIRQIRPPSALISIKK